MEYKGKLYGKVGGEYFQMLNTSDDIDELVSISENLLERSRILSHSDDEELFNEAEKIINKFK